MIPPLSFIIVLLTLSYIYKWGEEPIPLFMFLIMIPLFIIILLLFYRMKTAVGSKEIIVSYGIGIVKKRIQLKDIDEIVVARNKWQYGLGIRFLKGGTLYNIHSLNGIELRFKNRDRFIRIGSREPEKLISEIELGIKYMGKY